VRMFTTGHPDDDARLEALAEDDGLSQEHRWSHFLWFPTKEAAEAAAARLEGSYETRVVENPLDPGWILQALRDGVLLSQDLVVEAREQLTGLAQTSGGRYDGWQAWT
jgi:Regulator of ribonuclease activity B